MPSPHLGLDSQVKTMRALSNVKYDVKRTTTAACLFPQQIGFPEAHGWNWPDETYGNAFFLSPKNVNPDQASRSRSSSLRMKVKFLLFVCIAQMLFICAAYYNRGMLMSTADRFS